MLREILVPFFIPQNTTMRRSNVNSDKISIEYILSHRSQEEIMAFYLGISPHEIVECLHFAKCISAPYRKDNNPSFGFYENNNKLYGRDFAGYFWGDCFDMAAFMLHRGLSGKEFGKVLEQITYDLQIGKFAGNTGYIERKKFDSIKVNRTKLEFDIIAREWNTNDAKIWSKRYGFTSDFLDSALIYPVNNLFINKLLRYSYTRNNPAYAYYFGVDANGITNWKIYFPLADKKKGEKKFLQNSAAIEGALFLRKVEVLLITKSYKDACLINFIATIHNLSLLAIAPSAEGQIFSEAQFQEVSKYADIIYTLSDFDLTGIKFGNRMRKNYNTKPLFLTNGRFGTINFKTKDSTDFAERYSFKVAEEFVLYLFNNLKNNYQLWEKKIIPVKLE